MPLLEIIIASTRPGRVGEPVATWFQGVAQVHGGFTVEMVDLAEVNLPLVDDPDHLQLGDQRPEPRPEWAARLTRADAYVFVVPEYDYGFNAAVKNAVDYLRAEWAGRPVGFVSYGGVAAGSRAVGMLTQVVRALRMQPAARTVAIPYVNRLLREGVVVADQPMNDSAAAMLDELAQWTEAGAHERESLAG
jgi:NAD(P)H-dependent FMN reductase